MSLTFTEHIVAFIDILGFKEIVSRSEKDDKQLQQILECLEFIKGHEVSDKWGLQYIEIEESAQKKGVQRFKIGDDVQCTCFSDSIAVSVPVSDNSVNEVVSTLVANLAYMGARLLTEGVLIRGGVTVGNIIHQNGGVIIGQALIDAHELEKTLAMYPRIILSNELIGRLNYPINFKSESYPYHQYLTRFKDGCVGFSQLRFFQVIQSWVAMTDGHLKEGLNKSRQTIIDGLNHSAEHPHVYAKYEWLRVQYEELVILESGLKPCIKAVPENSIHFPK
ncbi:MAG: hypothetical protein HY016_05100 [Nitrosomonadales bacterium]|nr:hypothetical protein [Nitrosomonadales bacterium]